MNLLPKQVSRPTTWDLSIYMYYWRPPTWRAPDTHCAIAFFDFVLKLLHSSSGAGTPLTRAGLAWSILRKESFRLRCGSRAKAVGDNFCNRVIAKSALHGCGDEWLYYRAKTYKAPPSLGALGCPGVPWGTLWSPWEPWNAPRVPQGILGAPGVPTPWSSGLAWGTLGNPVGTWGALPNVPKQVCSARMLKRLRINVFARNCQE